MMHEEDIQTVWAMIREAHELIERGKKARDAEPYLQRAAELLQRVRRFLPDIHPASARNELLNASLEVSVQMYFMTPTVQADTHRRRH